eukprot:s256_g5.t1
MFTVAMFLSLELTVADITKPIFARALAWVVLCMTWGAMRSDDMQSVLPHRSVLSSFGLRLVLGKSKTTGPDKVQKEVSMHVFGYDIWSQDPSNCRRDYMVMEPSKDWPNIKRKLLTPSALASAIAKLLVSLCCPRRTALGWELMPALHLLPDGLESFFFWAQCPERPHVCGGGLGFFQG